MLEQRTLLYNSEPTEPQKQQQLEARHSTTHAGHSIAFCTLWPRDLDLWPIDLIGEHVTLWCLLRHVSWWSSWWFLCSRRRARVAVYSGRDVAYRRTDGREAGLCPASEVEHTCRSTLSWMKTTTSNTAWCSSCTWRAASRGRTLSSEFHVCTEQYLDRMSYRLGLLSFCVNCWQHCFAVIVLSLAYTV